jgi:hypothetical protein
MPVGEAPWSRVGEDAGKIKTSPLVQGIAQRAIQVGRDLDNPESALSRSWTGSPSWSNLAMPESRLRASDVAGGFSYSNVDPSSYFPPKTGTANRVWSSPGGYGWVADAL